MATILSKELRDLLACERNLLERQVHCIEEKNDFDWRVWLDVDAIEGTEGEDFGGLTRTSRWMRPSGVTGLIGAGGRGGGRLTRIGSLAAGFACGGVPPGGGLC